jgi:DNA-binding NarL/FixJ family response regulator
MAIVALGLVRRDLFFRSKLDAVAESLGAEILYASDLTNAARRATEKQPSIVFADLSDAAYPAADTAAQIRAAAPDAKLIGFASHIDLKPLRAAREAGFDQTLSRSEFTARLAEFLRP